jgi:hypothetical protein
MIIVGQSTRQDGAKTVEEKKASEGRVVRGGLASMPKSVRDAEKTKAPSSHSLQVPALTL